MTPRYLSMLPAFVLVCFAACAVDRPNFLILMEDDVSPEMFGCYGNAKAKTPNLDKLAREGVQFETAWNAAICCPARAQIMSGCYATKTGFWYNGFAVPQKDGSSHLFKHFKPFSKILQEAGYRTATAGKWHIGSAETQDEKSVGFDEYCMWEGAKALARMPEAERPKTHGDGRYWYPLIVQNHKYVKVGKYDFGPDIYANFLCDFIKRSAADKKPFLAYYPMVLPHGPYVETPARTKEGSNDLEKSKLSNEQRFRELVDYGDVLLGRLLEAVQDAGVRDNTIIIFLSDNGTACVAKSRGVERGCHVPFVVSGPGIKKRGMTKELTDSTDLLPTLAGFAGIKLPADAPYDGKSLVPFLTGKTDTHRDYIHGCVGTTQLLRTKTHLLEVVNSVLGVPRGRFYFCGDNRDGRKYVRAESNPEHASVRKFFDGLLKNKFVGLKKDDPVFKSKKGARWLKTYTAPKNVAKHLHNHKDFQFYDEKLDID